LDFTLLLNRRTFCAATAGVAATQAFGSESAYPNRPVTLIVTTPAGGVTDALFRRLADICRGMTGQSFVVENRPGGGTLIAMNYLRGQRPDGYTISMVGRSVLSQYWINNGKLPFHPVNDLTWISRLNGSAFAIVTKADSKLKSWADIVAFAKQNPNKLSYGGYTAVGGMTHVAIVDASRKDGLQMQYIPYKGDAEVLQAVIGGHLDFAVVGGSFRGAYEGKQVIPLAFLTEQRVEEFPNVPTLKEAGYDVTIDASIGVVGPKGMAPEVVAKLEALFAKAVQAPEFKAMLERTMQMATYLDSRAFSQWAKSQLEVERGIVDKFDLRVKS
jgi:tripartite-type tricarboxylate transporter receptor subunit TctC